MEKSFNRAGNAIGKLVIVKLLFLLLAFAIIITMTTVYFVNDMNTLSAIGTGILFITDIILYFIIYLFYI